MTVRKVSLTFGNHLTGHHRGEHHSPVREQFTSTPLPPASHAEFHSNAVLTPELETEQSENPATLMADIPIKLVRFAARGTDVRT